MLSVNIKKVIMKMLKIWFCIWVLGLVFPVIVSAQTTSKSIQVRAGHDYLQNRSLLPKIPVLASIDGTSLYSDFVQTTGEVTIAVTD